MPGTVLMIYDTMSSDPHVILYHFCFTNEKVEVLRT